MADQNSKVIEFRCGLNGVFSKVAPDLLKDGQYRSALNIVSAQEGSVGSRAGTKQVGVLNSALPTCYFIRKLVVQAGEDPLTPSANPRYLGILTSGGARHIYRTTDYTDANTAVVASNVDSSASRHWEMADFASGESGQPWAYFACPNAMLKDRGATPYTTLPKWGILPAVGVPLAAAVQASIAIATTGVNRGYPQIGDQVVITLSTPGGLSDFDKVTISGVTGATITTSDGRTDINDTWEIRIGVPDKDFNILNGDLMFRLFDTNAQAVIGTFSGIPGVGSVAGVPVPGNLDGGAESSANTTEPYDYALAYEETDTGDTGNPSQPMATGGTATLVDTGVTYSVQPLAIHNGQAKLVVWGTSISNIGYIRVYRRGGLLTDGIFRLLARVANPGSEAYTIITDNTADADIINNEQLETDNDPPVTSSVGIPIRSTLSGAVSTGWHTVTIATGVLGPVNPGTRIHIIDSAGGEDVFAETIPSSTTFRAYFQFAHASGVAVEVDAITSQNCNLVVTIDEQILVAGDPNNPHIIYKSKRSRPQAFPVGSDAAGAVTSIGVGTPSNRILALTECRGQACTLNVNAIYEVAILNASLQQPARVAEKGLRGQSAWCKDDAGTIWYLSDDGVYTWNGSFHQKRTEAIDTLFHGQQYNGMVPLDLSDTAMAAARMEFRRGIVRLLYIDTAGKAREIVCEPMYGDRWTPIRQDVYETSLPQYPTTMLYREPDTQSLIVAVNNPLLGATFGVADTTVIINNTNLTSDWWASTVPHGNPIPWSLTLPWFDMGAPAMQKLFEEVWLDIDPQLYFGVTGYDWNPSITVDLLLNYSDTPADSFNLAIPSGDRLVGRQLISLLPNLQNTSGSIYESYGREARSISFRLSGSAYPVAFSLFGILIQSQPTGLLSAGAASDWVDLGSKHDKRLYQMAVVFETAGTNRQIVLESRGGVTGKTAGTPQIFTLSSPTDLGSGRCLCQFPLAEPTIGKLFRTRPHAAAALVSAVPQSSVDLFRILEVTFPDMEEYPADVVILTPWTNGGYDYLKYAQQVTLQVNTNNVAVTVKLQADGADKATFTVTSTEADRQRVITLPPGLTGYEWRLTVDPVQTAIATNGGMWQLWSHHFAFQQADKGEVGHTFDWDDLGHPYDKELLTVTFEYDTTSGGPVTLQMDTISGIGGATLTANVIRFTLGSGRGKTTFPLPADTVVKMIRVYPVSTTVGYKQWKYSFDKINYPADIVRVTAWKDASAPVDKEPSWLWIDADTSGVAASVVLQNELGTALTTNHTGTSGNRKKNYAIAADTRAKMWRLLPTEGGGGRCQLFDWGFERWQPFALAGPIDPPEIILATPWVDGNYPYDKIARTLSMTINTGGVACGVAVQTSDAGTVYSTTINTTFATRRTAPIGLPSNLAGKLWRLVFTPGTNGLSQLWDWNLDFIQEPPAVLLWDSYEQNLGSKFFKFVKQGWWMYQCANPVTLTVTSDTGSFSVTLPAHAARGEERFYLDVAWASGLNKSKLYRVTLSASTPLKFYPTGSGFEYLVIAGDRHVGYQQSTFAEMMPLAA